MSWLLPQLGFAKPENPRKKVELGAGKGLLQWIRLSSSGDLASQKLEYVNEAELMKHDNEKDCWILLFDMVYDVTKYLEYHPGGIPELVRAAGTDATELFNGEHMWVNYQEMLKSCSVGRFKGDRSKLKAPKTLEEVGGDSSNRQKLM